MTEEQLKGELDELLEPIRKSQLELTEIILKQTQRAFEIGLEIGKEIDNTNH